jgi:hypothetical protein
MSIFQCEAEMARRLSWEKRRFDGRKKSSIVEEEDFRSKDFTSKWLKGAEAWEVRAAGIRRRREEAKKKSLKK